MEMFGWTEQMCHCYCPGQSCKHYTHRKPCTSSLSMTLPSPSGCCPAARSSFAETGLQDPPLGKVRPAITCGEAKVMLQQSTCFGRAKKVSKRRQAFLNCNKKLWQQSNKKFVEKTCTRKSSSEKRATALIFGPVPNSSSLCWSLTFW